VINGTRLGKQLDIAAKRYLTIEPRSSSTVNVLSIDSRSFACQRADVPIDLLLENKFASCAERRRASTIIS
jgi:hypothetical protein